MIWKVLPAAVAEPLASSLKTWKRSWTGCAVASVTGEPGAGKSRLCFEFAERWRARGVPVREAHGVSHGRLLPLLPVVELLRSYFDVTEHDAPRVARNKIAGALLLLDRTLEPVLPVVFELLGIGEGAPAAGAAPGERGERQLIDVVQRLIRGSAPCRSTQPSLVFVPRRRLPCVVVHDQRTAAGDRVHLPRAEPDDVAEPVVHPDLKRAANHSVRFAQHTVAKTSALDPFESEPRAPAERRVRATYFIGRLRDRPLLLGRQTIETLDLGEKLPLRRRHRGPGIGGGIVAFGAHDGCTEISTGTQTCPWIALPDEGGETVTTSALSIQSK